MKPDADEILSSELSQLLLIDHQPKLAVAVQSMDRRRLESNAVALARAADALRIPVTLTVLRQDTDAVTLSRELADAFPDHRIVARRSADVWDDPPLMGALALNARRQLVLSGLSTQSTVCASAISTARGANYAVCVVTDACGDTSAEAHALACRRMRHAGARLATLEQVLAEWQVSASGSVAVGQRRGRAG